MIRSVSSPEEEIPMMEDRHGILPMEGRCRLVAQVAACRCSFFVHNLQVRIRQDRIVSATIVVVDRKVGSC